MIRLFLILYFFIQVAYANELSIAIFDTGFCKKPQVSRSYDFNVPFRDRIDCSWIIGPNPRLHGQWVINELINLNNDLKRKIKVHLYRVFNERGVLTNELIQRSLDDAKKKGVKFVLFAGGKPEIDVPKIQSDLFLVVSSGQIGRGINKKTLLWPQNYYDKKKMIIASFYKRVGEKNFFLTGGLLNIKESDVFFLEEEKKGRYLSGSSLAAIKAADFIIKNCLNETNLKECFMSKRKTKKIDGREVYILK